MSAVTINYESLIRKNRSGTSSPAKVIKLACIVCELEIDDPRRNRCPDCNGAVDAIYDLDNFVTPEQVTTPNTLHRYFSLLPLKERESVHWLGEGDTPCFEVPALAAELGVGRLFFKPGFGPAMPARPRSLARSRWPVRAGWARTRSC